MASRRLTVEGLAIEGLGAAVRFLPVAWARVWAGLALAGVVLAMTSALGLWSPQSPWRGAAFLAMLAASVVALGGLYRTALDAGSPGPAGLQWGSVEFRLVAVAALTALFLFILGLLAFVVLLSFAFAVASAGKGFVTALPMTWANGVDARGRAVMAIIVAFCAAGMVWAWVRVSLSGAASVARGRLQVLASWPATRGLVWSIVLGNGLLALPVIGAAALALSIARHAAPTDVVVLWIAHLCLGGVVAGLWLPMSARLMAYFYQHSPAS